MSLRTTQSTWQHSTHNHLSGTASLYSNHSNLCVLIIGLNGNISLYPNKHSQAMGCFTLAIKANLLTVTVSLSISCQSSQGPRQLTKEWGHIPAPYPSMDVSSCGLQAAGNREPAFQTHSAVWRWTGWCLQSRCLQGEMCQWHNHGWHLLGFKQGKHLSRRKKPGWPLIVYHYWQIWALLPRYAAIQDTRQRSQKRLLVSIHVLLVLLSYLSWNSKTGKEGSLPVAVWMGMVPVVLSICSQLVELFRKD